MPDATWKAWERTVAILFNGKRRGAYTGSNDAGKSDIIKPGWSIECKLLGRIGWQDCLDAVGQAERNAESPNDIKIAVIKKKGGHLDQAMVVMKLSDFVDKFVNIDSKG